MAIVDGQNTDQQQQQAGADDQQQQQQQANDGNRADTNRAGQQQQQQPQDGDQRRGADGKVYTFKEDRGNWVPPHRLSEETGKRTKLETELAALRQQHELNEKKIRILAGVEPVNEDDAKAAEIREALFKTYPKLRLLEKLDESQLERILGAADSAESATKAQWDRHRTIMLADLEEEAADLLGVDKLTEAQVKRLHRAFREEGRDNAVRRAQAEQLQDSTYDYDNDFVSRYERGDRALLREFAKSFIEEWGIPARRQANASMVRQGGRPTPRGGRERTPLTQGPPKINYNDDKEFGAAMIAGRRGGDGA